MVMFVKPVATMPPTRLVIKTLVPVTLLMVKLVYK